MSEPQDKAALRAKARALRKGLAWQAGAAASAQFAEHFFAHVPLRARSLIAGYFPIGSEADPSALLEQAFEFGHACALPKVALEGAPLNFVAWRPGEALGPGPFGTREPPGDPLFHVPNIVLVPLLAFDAGGHRLGYGGGYYDRTLALMRGGEAKFLAVGLAFAGQEVDALPADPHDQRLDWIVTEKSARQIG